MSVGGTSPAAGAGGTSAGAGGILSVAGGAAAGAAGSAGAPAGEELSLDWSMGWVDRTSNSVGIQGQIAGFGDPVSSLGLVTDVIGPSACMRGTAAKVDIQSMTCATRMFTPPATDCYAEFWGAELALNLNQSQRGVNELLPFDASALTGFSFDINGPMVPIPKDLRFKVVNADGVEFCSPLLKKIRLGSNVVLFSDLLARCYVITAAPPNPTAESAKSGLVLIAWQVVTNISSTVPFDFCVSNVRAVR